MIIKIHRNWTDAQIKKSIQEMFTMIEGYGNDRHMVKVGHEQIRKSRAVLAQRARGIYWEQL